jgi:hypothetical protein
VVKNRKPRPRSRHGDGSGWIWTIITGGTRTKSRSGGGRPSSLTGAITRIVSFFWTDVNKYERRQTRFTERRRGRRPMARVHPHRYRRRETKL